MAGIFYLNGLSPEPHRHHAFEDRALSEFNELDIATRHAEMDYRSPAMLSDTINALAHEASAFADEHGEVAVVGHSAGGSMVVHMAHRLTERVNIQYYSIAGRLRVGEYGPLHPRGMVAAAHMGIYALGGHEYFTFSDAVRSLDRNVIPALTDEVKDRITILKPRLDQVVPRNLMDIEGVKTVVLPAFTHNRAAVHGLGYILYEMRDRTSVDA